jgi:hypothetical protein
MILYGHPNALIFIINVYLLIKQYFYKTIMYYQYYNNGHNLVFYQISFFIDFSFYLDKDFILIYLKHEFSFCYRYPLFII